MSVETCSYILPNKKRRCRMPVKAGQSLCVAHSQGLPRCPECGTRLLSDDALARHVSVVQTRAPLCPALKRRLNTESQPYYRRNVNIASPRDGGEDDGNDDDHKEAEWQSSMSMDEIENLVTAHVLKRITPSDLLVYHCMSEIPTLAQAATIHASWADDNDSTIKLERKHFEQFINLSSLCLHSTTKSTTTTDAAAAAGAVAAVTKSEAMPLTKDIGIMELGAGRAYMSLYLVDVLQSFDSTMQPHVFMVDRCTQRLKADRTLRKHRTLESLHRITMDLRHLHLASMAQLASIQTLIVVAKHLCGSALDLALTCVNDFVHHPDHRHRHVKLTFACCCRALCQWSYFGQRAAVWKSLQLDRTQVTNICKAAAWGLAPHCQSYAQLRQHEKADVNGYHQIDESKRARVGALCRKAVDVVRVKWLRDNGWNTQQLWTYTDASPESTCIVAEWNPSQKGAHDRNIT